MTKQQTTRDQLNAAVRALAAKDKPGGRDAAVAILAKFGVLTTAELKHEDIPAAHAAFVEALKRFDASPS